MSKLEEVMSQRASAERSAEAAKRRAEEAKEKKQRRQRRLFERKEFNRLFSRLRTLVDGRWDRYGHGWKFDYKGEEYYIAYEHWFSPKDPGDADGYDMSGNSWMLKRGFNGGDGHEYTLSNDYEPKKGLTEAVLRGLKELQDRNGRRWE
jgi:hypothetical protein